MKKVFALLLALMMIFTLAACGGASDNGGSNGPAYKSAVDLLASVKYQGKVENIERLAPENYWTSYENNNKMSRDSKIEEVTYTVEMEFAAYQQAFGEGFTISLDMKERSTYTESELANIKSTLSEQFGIDAASVTEAKLLDVTVTIAGTMSHEEAMDVSVVKIGNTWYCAELYVYESGCAFMFPTDFLGGWG